MIPTQHNLVNIPERNTQTDVYWHCTRCGNGIGFNRLVEGGDPSVCGTETTYPEAVDTWFGECPGEAPAPPIPLFCSRAVFLKSLTPEELAGMRAHACPRMQHFLYLFEHTEMVEINSASLLSDLKYAEALTILATGRAQAIVDSILGA